MARGADDREGRDLLRFHTAFFVGCAVALALPVHLAAGWRITFCTVLYFVALPFVARRWSRPEWNDLWFFLVPLSAAQVLPDWFLSSVLEVLVFPDDGSPRIGTVCAYMAGLWIIPLFLVVRGADLLARRWPGNGERTWRGPVFAGVLALLIFGASEALSHRILRSWYAKDVWMIGDVAVYVLPPETLLGVATYVGARQTETANLVTKATVGFAVALLYTGALAVSYMFVEGYAFP